jgi:hypothetical protein
VKLDDLDERLVPGLAGRLRRFVDTAGERWQRAGASMRRRAAALADPAPTAPLRRLDDRFAAHGPLALLRDVPQLGLLLVAAVFLAGSGVALERSGSKSRAVQTQAASVAPTTLGPAPGTSIAAYIAATRKRAVAVSKMSPAGT